MPAILVRAAEKTEFEFVRDPTNMPPRWGCNSCVPSSRASGVAENSIVLFRDDFLGELTSSLAALTYTLVAALPLCASVVDDYEATATS